MRHRLLAPGGGVVDAEGKAALIDPVEAIVGAGAGADALFLPGDDLAHQMRIGHVGAGHADEVHLAAGHRMAGGGNIGNARGMEGRQLCLRPDAAGKIQMRGTGHALNGDHVRQARIRIDMAAHHIEEVDKAAVLQAAGDFQPVLRRQPALQPLIARVADADDEIRPRAPADLAQHIEGKAQPVIERPAIGAVQRVGQRRPELIHQMAIGFQLDAIHAAGLHALGRIAIVLDDPLDVPVLQLLGEGPVRGLPRMGGGDDGQPVALVPAGAAAEMGELDHDGRALLMHRVRQLPCPFHHLVLPGEDVVEDGRAVARHGGGACGHRHGHPGLRPLHVIGAVTGLGHAVFRIGGLMRGDDDPVAQGEMLELEWLKKRVAGHGSCASLEGRFSSAKWKCALVSSFSA